MQTTLRISLHQIDAFPGHRQEADEIRLVPSEGEGEKRPQASTVSLVQRRYYGAGHDGRSAR